MTSSQNVFISCKLTRINPVNSLQAVYIYFTHWKSGKKNSLATPSISGVDKSCPIPPSPPSVVSLCQPSYDKLCWEELLWNYKYELNLNTSQRTLLLPTPPPPPGKTGKPRWQGKVNGIDFNSKQIILVKPHTESIEGTVPCRSSAGFWCALILDSNLESGAELCVCCIVATVDIK